MGFWESLKSCLFTVEGIVFVICVGLALYKICTTTKKVFPFRGIDLSFDTEEKKQDSKPETRCREILENVFGYKFDKLSPSDAPEWLRNPKGFKLELDGYCPFIKTPLGRGLAFEYDGRQHSKYTPYFHKTEQDFVNQVKNDFFKDKACRNNGLFLLRVPHFVPFEKLESYIKDKLREKGILNGDS